MTGTVVSFINMKGGVGKTTLTINLAYTLFKEYDKKVLLVDMDPQFNATQALFTKFRTIDEYGELVRNEKTIINLLSTNQRGIVAGEKILNYDDIITNLLEAGEVKFDIIPGDLNLTSFESSDRGSEKLLRKVIESIKENYDYILIDTPATYSVYGQSSLLASDYYIVPVLPDTFATLGYDLLQNKVKEDIVLEDSKVKNLGVIITLDKPTLAKRNEIISTFQKEKFKNTLPENEHIRAGSLRNFIYDMSSTRSDIVDLTKELMDKIDGDDYIE